MNGIYIHIPFCSGKCYYCGFTSFPGRKNRYAEYVKALSEEMRFFRGYGADTLYLGGGTPTELPAGLIDEILSAVEKNFRSVRGFRESCVEANPESLSGDKIEVLRGFGISRISLGLQCVQDGLLKSLGRRHSFADFERVFRALRSAGFLNINVDLMTAFPGQTMEDFKESLSYACSIGADNISFYSLQVEEKTVFYKRGVQSDGDAARSMFDWAADKLSSGGYAHYEISNFAKPGKESQHNLIYWDGGEYLGLGCGASGYVNGERKTNPCGLDEYMKPLLEGRLPEPAVVERLAGKEKLGETILLGLRKIRGIEVGRDMEREFGREFAKLKEAGLIEFDGKKARLTKEGIYLGNIVFREFVPPFE